MNKITVSLFGVLIAIMMSLMSWSLLITHRLTVNQAVLIENMRMANDDLKQCKSDVSKNKERLLILEINEKLD